MFKLPLISSLQVGSDLGLEPLEFELFSSAAAAPSSAPVKAGFEMSAPPTGGLFVYQGRQLDS